MTAKIPITFDDFYKLDLRVAKIVWVSKVGAASRLLKVTLEVGELGERIVVAKIGMTYTPEELIGKKVVYLANLRPQRISGIVSCGALLVANQVVFVADKSVRPGTLLT